MLVKLKYLSGSLVESVEELTLPVIKIGRAPTCDFVLYDSGQRHKVASRVHAELRREDNDLVLYDLHSSNGTFVNNERIDRRPLATGDRLLFGLDGLLVEIFFSISSTDEFQFLKNCYLFQGLSDEMLQQIYSSGQIVSYPGGSYLFRYQQLCTHLYIIYSGFVEVWGIKDERGTMGVLSYLASGECLGETLALPGDTHLSEALVPESAEVFLLHARQLRELMESTPSFAIHYSTVLSKQLNKNQSRFYSKFARQLQGSLRYFDLATIIQTLSGLQETGLLTFYNLNMGLFRSSPLATAANASPFAHLYYELGEVRYVQFGRRTGEQAFYQLFQMPLEGSFSFGIEDPPEQLLKTEPIRKSGLYLLMEAMRLQDELNNIKERLPSHGTIFQRNKPMLEWQDETTLTFAQQVWDLLGNNKIMMIELLNRTPCCNYYTYTILLKLLETHQTRTYT
ncbi:MAG: FHA domain-containing protein [Acidobacteriota bacterium]